MGPRTTVPEFKPGQKVYAYHRKSDKWRPAFVLTTGSGVVVVVVMGTKSFYSDANPPPVEVKLGTRQAITMRLTATTYFYQNKIEAIATSQLKPADGHAPPGVLVELQKLLQRPVAEQNAQLSNGDEEDTTEVRRSGVVPQDPAAASEVATPQAAAVGDKRRRSPPPGSL